MTFIKASRCVLSFSSILIYCLCISFCLSAVSFNSPKGTSWGEGRIATPFSSLVGSQPNDGGR